MAKEIEYFASSGLTIYAKSSPITESPWSTGVVALTESGTVSGYYTADITTPLAEYTLFEQSGGSPIGTDTPVALVKFTTSSGTTGSGARTVVFTINDGATVLQNATIRLTEGVNTYRGVTDVSGNVTFNVDDATYTIAITKSGYTYAGSSLIVSADATPTLSLTIVAPSASSAGFSTGYMYTYDLNGILEEDVIITSKISKVPTGSGLALDSVERTATSNGSGYVEFTGLIIDAKYKFKRSTGKWIEVTIPDSASFEITNLFGED